MHRVEAIDHQSKSPSGDLRERLHRDVETLASLDRRTSSEGERRSADWIARRLREIGADGVRVSSFRTQSSWAFGHLGHLAAGLVAAGFSGPLARLAAAGVATSYELDVSGRSHWLRRLLPGGRGVSVSARVPSEGPRRRTLVLVAHHDAAHAGLVWHPRTIAANRNRSQRTGRTIPSHMLPLTALVVAALPGRRVRRAAQSLIALSGLLFIESASSSTAPGANDNATGVAAVLELGRRLARKPLPDTEVLLVFPGGEEVGNTGMRAWMREARPELDPSTTLVVNLDAIGSGGHLVVTRREGLTGWLAAEDVALALSVAVRQGINLRRVTLPNVCDAVIARHAGLRTISLLSYRDGWVANLHRPSDTPDNVGWNTVEDALALTEGIVEAWPDGRSDA